MPRSRSNIPFCTGDKGPSVPHIIQASIIDCYLLLLFIMPGLKAAYNSNVPIDISVITPLKGFGHQALQECPCTAVYCRTISKKCMSSGADETGTNEVNLVFCGWRRSCGSKPGNYQFLENLLRSDECPFVVRSRTLRNLCGCQNGRFQGESILPY